MGERWREMTTLVWMFVAARRRHFLQLLSMLHCYTYDVLSRCLKQIFYQCYWILCKNGEITVIHSFTCHNPRRAWKLASLRRLLNENPDPEVLVDFSRNHRDAHAFRVKWRTHWVCYDNSMSTKRILRRRTLRSSLTNIPGPRQWRPTTSSGGELLLRSYILESDMWMASL